VAACRSPTWARHPVATLATRSPSRSAATHASASGDRSCMPGSRRQGLRMQDFRAGTARQRAGTCLASTVAPSVPPSVRATAHPALSASGRHCDQTVIDSSVLPAVQAVIRSLVATAAAAASASTWAPAFSWSHDGRWRDHHTEQPTGDPQDRVEGAGTSPCRGLARWAPTESARGLYMAAMGLVRAARGWRPLGAGPPRTVPGCGTSRPAVRGFPAGPSGGGGAGTARHGLGGQDRAGRRVRAPVRRCLCSGLVDQRRAGRDDRGAGHRRRVLAQDHPGLGDYRGRGLAFWVSLVATPEPPPVPRQPCHRASPLP
jgi:hypothetical protein